MDDKEIGLREELEKSLKALLGVERSEDYDQARADLFSSLHSVRQNDNKELIDQVEAVQKTLNMTYMGDATRTLLMKELELLIQMMNLNEEYV